MRKGGVTATFVRSFEVWNRKLHIYVGLSLLLFVWLFAFSGLLLNHPKWRFSQFWPQRRQSSYERSVSIPATADPLTKARSLMTQLGLSGEIALRSPSSATDAFEFQAVRPGRIVTVKTNLLTHRATVEQIQTNGWGVLYVLHSFTGVRMDDPRQARDWLLTRIWSLSMDTVSVGLLLWVFSGVYMWYRLKRKHRLGLVVIGIGLLICGFYVFGFRWMP